MTWILVAQFSCLCILTSESCYEDSVRWCRPDTLRTEPGSAYLAAIVMILILKPIGGISLWFALLKVVLWGVILGWLTNIFILNLELYSDTNLYLACERDCNNKNRRKGRGLWKGESKRVDLGFVLVFKVISIIKWISTFKKHSL